MPWTTPEEGARGAPSDLRELLRTHPTALDPPLDRHPHQGLHPKERLEFTRKSKNPTLLLPLPASTSLSSAKMRTAESHDASPNLRSQLCSLELSTLNRLNCCQSRGEGDHGARCICLVRRQSRQHFSNPIALDTIPHALFSAALIHRLILEIGNTVEAA